MQKFTDEEQKLQKKLSLLATGLRELAFEIEIGKYKFVEINHRNLIHKIGDGVGVIGHQEYGFEIIIKVLY